MNDWTDEPLDDAYFADADTYYGIGESEEFERTQPRGATPQKPLRQTTPPPVPAAPTPTPPEAVDIFGAVSIPDQPPTTAPHPAFPEASKRPAYSWRTRRKAAEPKKDPAAPESGIAMYTRLRSEGFSADYAAEQAVRHQKEIMNGTD